MSKDKIKLPKVEEMLEAGVHFGHQVRRRSPFMDKFVYGIDNKSHIIDVYKTSEYLKEAAEFLYDAAKEGSQMVIVGTKRQASSTVKELAEKAGVLYVNERWLGGTFTNFNSIKNRIEKMERMITQRENKEFTKYTKREQLMLDREIEKLELLLGGIRNIKKYPEVIIVTDMKKEKVAISEAKAVGTKIVALVDTNSDPREIDYPIPANDDAIKSIKLILETLADAIVLGAKDKPVTKDEKVSTKVKKEKK